jgi:hypothetical protein
MISIQAIHRPRVDLAGHWRATKGIFRKMGLKVVAIVSDRPWCGSEIGGDPRPCPAMAAAIDALYNGVSAEQARATCHQYGIHYLIARIYDPAWSDKNGWVWTLKPVVSQNEFRALDCGL